MSVHGRSLKRKQLQKLLSSSPDKPFLNLIWAVDALQSGREFESRKVLRLVPDGAATPELTSPFSIRKWELETLANELLIHSKRPNWRSGKPRHVDCTNFHSIGAAANILRSLEDHEFDGTETNDLLREMYRLANRQFEWQRGWLNKPLLYRSALLYNGPVCSKYLREVHDTSVEEMTLVGMALHTLFQSHPNILGKINLEKIGLRSEAPDRVLARICRPISELRSLAANIRRIHQPVAYRPSVFRQFPIVQLPGDEPLITCPLPALIIERVTSGVFYDVVGSPGNVRDEYGRRFEKYCTEYIRKQLPESTVRDEQLYTYKKQQYRTPDVLVGRDHDVFVAIECKATKMPFNAKFADNAEESSAYEELVKAVVQLWRFFSHCRLGNVDLKASDDAIGIVLTLDSWLVMGGPVTKEIFRRAGERADNVAEIIAEDRRPVIFSPVPDVESVLSDTDEAGFRQTLAMAVDPNYEGWMLPSVFKETGLNPLSKPFPFNIGDQLPWWQKIVDSASQAI